MKSIKLYIILILCLVFMPFENVYADENFEFSVYAEPAVVDASGGQTKLKFAVSMGEGSNEVITNCQFKVDAPSGVKLVSDEPSNGWNVTTGTKGYVLDNVDGVANGVIMNAIYEVYSATTITISNIECGNSETDNTFTSSQDIKVDVKIADNINIKINGVAVTGGVTTPLAANKSDFVLSVVSADVSLQNGIKVEMADTSGGSVQLCSGDACKDITVDFISGNFCVSSECLGLKSQMGDVIQLKVYSGDSLNKTFYVIREQSGEAPVLDPTIKYLKVWGVEVELKPGEREYPVTVPANVTDYTVQATLSDPENFYWDEEDNPDKYNFKTDTINLILRPKDTEAIGAEVVTYVIRINQDGDSSDGSSKPSASNPSSNKPSSNNPSSNPSSNPQTSGISQFVVAIILFVSLFVALNFYRKNMEEYK